MKSSRYRRIATNRAKAVAPENGDSAGPEAEIAVHAAPAEPASDSSDSVPEQPAEGRPKVIRQRFVRKPREQEPEADAFSDIIGFLEGQIS